MARSGKSAGGKARVEGKVSKEPGGDSVRVRLELDLAPGTLTLEGRVANLDVRGGARGLDVRGRLGRISLEDLVAEFRAKKPDAPPR